MEDWYWNLGPGESALFLFAIAFVTWLAAFLAAIPNMPWLSAFLVGSAAALIVEAIGLAYTVVAGRRLIYDGERFKVVR